MILYFSIALMESCIHGVLQQQHTHKKKRKIRCGKSIVRTSKSWCVHPLFTDQFDPQNPIMDTRNLWPV